MASHHSLHVASPGNYLTYFHDVMTLLQEQDGPGLNGLQALPH